MIRKSGHKRHQPLLWQRCRSLRSLRQAHARMVVAGFDSSPAAVRELIYCAAVLVPGALGYAHQLFDQILHPDLFTWNTLIRGSAHGPCPSDAVSLFVHMERHGNCRGVRPNKYTFPFLLKACVRLWSLSLGSQLHGKISKFGLDSDGFVRNALINFHANCGNLVVADTLFGGPARVDVVAWSAMVAGYARRGELDVARMLFDQMPSKDLISWNVMITGYTRRGEMDKARELFDLVPEKDVVSWNAMIAGYVECRTYEKAMDIYEEMLQVGEWPDEVTMLSLLSACAEIGVLDIGVRMHHSLLEMVHSRHVQFTVTLGNALIDMYAKCGSIEKALKVFRGMREMDISTWNSIIWGLAFHGHVEESLHLFKEMMRQEVRPDEVTFVSVLVACSHGGLVEDGRKCFSLMREYAIKPNIKHFGCMVDMLGRAGLLDEAFEFMEGMGIQPNPIVWRTLLGACRLHGNVQLAEHANKQLLRMNRDDSGDYILLSNTYAAMGKWDEVQKVRKLMDDRGVPKEAGRSLIEADNQELMHFLFDKRHPLNLYKR
ncbi:hypothetical protein Taro_033701 [Colocasia esculenta]|uniref:Chlororespiratory reduction 4 n=1 Tax=Colocasia esculenta TaxID=4460 RepID=A0A843VPE7_COLES|nr:hypothetical protein [Colocasia esculenta]